MRWFKYTLVDYRGHNKKEFYLKYIGWATIWAIVVFVAYWTYSVFLGFKWVSTLLHTAVFISFSCYLLIDACVSYRRHVVRLDRLESGTAYRGVNLQRKNATKPVKAADQIDEKVI
jgi:hypothetical protein